MPPSTATLVMPALNAMIDIVTTRTMAARTHQPAIIFVMLLALVLLSALLVGSGMGGAPSRNWVHMIGTNCRAWLLTILRHTFLGRVTRDAREVLGRDESAVERALARCEGLTATPEEEFFQHVISDPRLARAMDGLSRRFREVLILADFEERSYREIAQMCELPIGTVMSRLSRARRLLRKALPDTEGLGSAWTL